MNWFKGNIAEAVNLSKSNNSIFVVFVQGNKNFYDKKTRQKRQINFFLFIIN